MAPGTAEELAGLWEAELSRALFELPTVEARFAFACALVAHHLEAAARAYPETASFAAQVLALLARGLRGEAYAGALAAIPPLAGETAPERAVTGLAHRPAGFVFDYDIYWAAADLAFEAGIDLAGAEGPPDPARVRAEIDRQRQALRAAVLGVGPPPAKDD